MTLSPTEQKPKQSKSMQRQQRQQRPQIPENPDLPPISLTELKEKKPVELAELCRELNLDNIMRLRKQDQIFAILKAQAKKGQRILGEGVVEILQDGFGFLRSASLWA